MSRQIQHTITIDEHTGTVHPASGKPVIRERTWYKPKCSCGGYSAAWGWGRLDAESRGRLHVQRAQRADARRAGIISSAAGRPLTGRHRAGGTA